jgi:hypothetical protein
VVSSSHCAAKAVVVPGRTRHIAYCHSPMRYAWDQFEEYFGAERVGKRMSRWVYRPLLARMARWDAATAPRVHRFNRQFPPCCGPDPPILQSGFDGRVSPVDTNFLPSQPGRRRPSPRPLRAALVVSALVPYKAVDRAIEACALAACRCASPVTDRTSTGSGNGPRTPYVPRTGVG